VRAVHSARWVAARLGVSVHSRGAHPCPPLPKSRWSQTPGAFPGHAGFSGSADPGVLKRGRWAGPGGQKQSSEHSECWDDNSRCPLRASPPSWRGAFHGIGRHDARRTARKEEPGPNRHGQVRILHPSVAQFTIGRADCGQPKQVKKPCVRTSKFRSANRGHWARAPLLSGWKAPWRCLKARVGEAEGVPVMALRNRDAHQLPPDDVQGPSHGTGARRGAFPRCLNERNPGVLLKTDGPRQRRPQIVHPYVI
jgi:hypothetical protein